MLDRHRIDCGGLGPVRATGCSSRWLPFLAIAIEARGGREKLSLLGTVTLTWRENELIAGKWVKEGLWQGAGGQTQQAWR